MGGESSCERWCMDGEASHCLVHVKRVVGDQAWLAEGIVCTESCGASVEGWWGPGLACSGDYAHIELQTLLQAQLKYSSTSHFGSITCLLSRHT